VAAALLSEQRAVTFRDLMQWLVFELEPLMLDASQFHVCLCMTPTQDAAADVDLEKVAQGWEMLPMRIRNGVGRIFILHSGMWFQMALNRSLPVELAQKVVFCDSIDDLYEQLGSKTVIFPEFVFAHEGGKGPAREIFAVACGGKWNQTMSALAAKAKQTLLWRDEECLEYLTMEKARFVKDERYADAALLTEEIDAIYSEIGQLRAELEALVPEDGACSNEDAAVLQEDELTLDEEIAKAAVLALPTDDRWAVSSSCESWRSLTWQERHALVVQHKRGHSDAGATPRAATVRLDD